MARVDGTGRRVAVLTAALPHRVHLLAECVESIRQQTHRPVAHLIAVDYEQAGCVATMNRLFESVDATAADWVALLADDDLAYPHHLETLVGASTGADIVYTWCDVEGRPGWNPNAHFDPDRLLYENYIPSTTLIRVELVRRLGGWKPGPHGWEDYTMWLRALKAGARFVCVPTITWRYRFTSSGNMTMGDFHVADRNR